ncbi:hypothetical protein Hanom_Chr11g00981591 [Helianthus anomalus]
MISKHFLCVGIFPLVQAKTSNFDSKHNICCVLDKKLSKMESFKHILDFKDRIRIKKALTDQHKAYRSHNASGKTPNSSLIHHRFNFSDRPEDPTGYPERMVKGCFYRMGYTGHVNKRNFSKANLSRPYKFFMHFVIHAMGHQKGGYDVVVDYVMCMIAALTLNIPYNFSKLIFEQMKTNLVQDRFLQYPRFVQMLLDDQIPNLAKQESDVLPLEHMKNLSLDRIQTYQKQSENDIPQFTRLFGCLKDKDYVAPPKGHWRNDDSDSDNEDDKLEGFVAKRCK